LRQLLTFLSFHERHDARSRQPVGYLGFEIVPRSAFFGGFFSASRFEIFVFYFIGGLFLHLQFGVLRRSSVSSPAFFFFFFFDFYFFERPVSGELFFFVSVGLPLSKCGCF
jgi:hypothetical protein